MDAPKSAFQLHEVCAGEALAVRWKFRRAEVNRHCWKPPPAFITIVSCGCSHHRACLRMLLTHDVKLMSHQHVKPAFSYPMSQTIAGRHLVRCRICCAMTARTAATRSFMVSRGDINWDAPDNATRVEIEVLFAEQHPLTADPAVLERKSTIPGRNRATVREFREVLEKGYANDHGCKRAPESGKTIVFA